METREEWLTRCAGAIVEELFAPMGFDTNADTGEPLIDNLKASVGYPPTRALNARGRAIGVCISPLASEGGVTEIFVSPYVSDGVEVAAVLVHELMHAHKGNKHGHDAVFEAACHAVGLEGPAIATVAGQALADLLQAITDQLGPYPHARINLTGTPKPDGIGFIPSATRLLKCSCVNPDCPSHNGAFVYGVSGYNVRVTWKWASQGTPFCGICGDRMSLHLPKVSGGQGGPPVIGDGGAGDGEQLPPNVPVIDPGQMASKGNEPGDETDGPGKGDTDDGPSDKGGDDATKKSSGKDKPSANPKGGKGVIDRTTKQEAKAHAVKFDCTEGLNGKRCETCEKALIDAGLLK